MGGRLENLPGTMTMRPEDGGDSDGEDLDQIRAELYTNALEVAGELVKRAPDLAVVAKLDERAAALRAVIRERTPPDGHLGLESLMGRW